jgi:hypothetical protein
MPAEARLRWKRLRLRGAIFGPRYRGYELELFGMTAPLSPTWPPPWPFWRLVVPGDAGPGITVQIWQQIVHFEGCPLWGEIRWHPERGERVTIHGLEQRHTKDDLKRVHVGLRLLREVVRGGGRRPRLSREEKRLVLQYIVKRARRNGIPPDRLMGEDAADLLEELCEHGHITIKKQRIHLPPPVTDRAKTPGQNRKAKRNRLEQWLQDIFEHQRWEEARAELIG